MHVCVLCGKRQSGILYVERRVDKQKSIHFVSCRACVENPQDALLSKMLIMVEGLLYLPNVPRVINSSVYLCKSETKDKFICCTWLWGWKACTHFCCYRRSYLQEGPRSRPRRQWSSIPEGVQTIQEIWERSKNRDDQRHRHWGGRPDL